MNNDALRFSRLRATAESLAAAAPDRSRFDTKKVLLTGEGVVLATENGKRCFLDCVLLLLRMVENFTICVSECPALATDVESLVRTYATTSKPTISASAPPTLEAFDAILSVGVNGRADMPWTVVNSNGWTARVASTGLHLPRDCSKQNPIGALAAACLGVSEVFKRLVQLKPDRGPLFERVFFSLHSYRTDEDNPGPQLPDELTLELLLVGAGAIGNGVIHLLRSLSWRGRIDVVDKQPFADENWGTCILVGPQTVGRPKALVAEELLKNPLRVAKGHFEGVEKLLERCGTDVPWPKIILTALDERAPRRTTQEFWPDQIIDGAIGPTSCEVTLHPWGPDLSCLKCDFEEPHVDATKTQVAATGLTLARVGDVHAQVEDTDIENAPDDRKEWLRARKGKPICSVVSEGVLALLSAQEHPAGFRPSVPFVACLSACMMIGELVGYVQRDTPVLQTGFQFDVLVGPTNGLQKSHTRKPQCACSTRRHLIDKLRQRRFATL